ncbi:hypothetical protein ACSBLW_14450 [Thioclava sp. FR2]|uniref:hypothetical protein n=1 Tax=Thioclava sp. FR2 TaxID=3445780 RepID=UPI003EBF6D9C
MAGSQADPVPFGCRIVCDTQLSGPASHDGAGNRFVLFPPAIDGFDYALDVERRDAPLPEFLTALIGPLGLKAWGEIEVVAKLLNVPAHLVLRRYLAEGLPAILERESIEIARSDTITHWRVVGRCRADGS